MRTSTTLLKRVLLSMSIVSLVLVTACSSPKDHDLSSNTPAVEAGKEEQKLTAFEKDTAYLSEKGFVLPELLPESTLNEQTLLELSAEAYEAIGTEIDISKVNPKYEASDAVKKMSLIGVYDNWNIENGTETSDVDYGAAGYMLMKLHDAIQKRVYARDDASATTGDLLHRINTSTALHTWTPTAKEAKTYTLTDVLQGEAAMNQPLKKLMTAEILVNAYEQASGEIPSVKTTQLTDTDNLYAKKANEFFFWSETGQFEPDKTGNWDDWSFMSAIIYDSQLRLGLELEEKLAPYGAVVSAMAALIREYEDIERHPLEELIVLNERPYDWHVYQQETGEYSAVNCMPSTAVMALKYQGISNPPTAEQLRNDNIHNGQGWHDMLAENVMLQYGLTFSDYFDSTMDLELMMEQLDQGNVLFVMYMDENIGEGHAAIIKGYWKLGDQVQFIMSDPNYNVLGPFGYLEYTTDAKKLIANMEVHVPRYFIIPSGDMI